jgi:hypothetical protein
MRLRSLALWHAVGFATVAGCGAIQLAAIARALSADQLGVVLSCVAWSTTLGELIDCRSWEVYVTHCRRHPQAARPALRQLLKYEFIIAVLIVLSGITLVFGFSAYWRPVLGIGSVLACLGMAAMSGMETLLRTALVRLQRFNFVWRCQMLTSVVGGAIALGCFWKDYLFADTALVLLCANRAVLLLLYTRMFVRSEDLVWVSELAARQTKSPPVRIEDLFWSNLRGSGRTLVARTDRILLPLLWPAQTFAAYDCARRVVDKVNGLGRPLADALLDRHLAAQGAEFERDSVRLALRVLPVAAVVSIAVALAALPVSIALYGSVLGKAAAPMVMVLCPICLLLSQAPVLPMLGTSELKRSLTIKSLFVAAALAISLYAMRSQSPLLSASVVSIASLSIGAFNMQAAMRLRHGEMS